MTINKKAVALLSGGLDSCLAIKVMQEQGIEIEALNYKSIFNCCKNTAGAAARALGVKLTLVPFGEDFLDIVRKPKFGWGRSVNPCEDCRIYMLKSAKKFMELVGASFLITGEVLGQRPKSQMRGSLNNIPRQAGLEGLILRPLSAKLLAPTLPEIEGIVDREKLCDIEGRSRKRLYELAKQVGLNIEDIPNASNGCILTDENYGERVKDHFAHCATQTFWDFETLRPGRHYRLDETHKLVVGRNAKENETLAYLHGREDGRKTTYFEPENFQGPSALLVGEWDQVWMGKVGEIVLSFCKKTLPANPQILYRNREDNGSFCAALATNPLEKIG